MEKELEKVMRALRLCGQGYHAGACKECPFIQDCVTGDNDVLIDAAYSTIESLVKVNDDQKKKVSQFAQIMQESEITVYIVIHRWKRGQEEYRVKTGLFRMGDAEKIGKTVFFRKADAEKKLRRLKNAKDIRTR